MKRKLFSIILAMILLVSCSISKNIERTDNKRNDNNIWIMQNVEGGVFRADFIYPQHDVRIENHTEKKETAVSIGNVIFEAYLAQSKYTEDAIKDVYKCINENIEICVDRDNDSFVITSGDNSVLHRYNTENINQSDFLTWVNEYILDLIPDEDLSGYTQSCTTKIAVRNADSAWSETKDGVYVPENANETIHSYVVDLILYCNDIRTSDRISVTCNANGDITSIAYYNSAADWTNAGNKFESGLAKLGDYIARAISDEYKLKDYSVLRKTLVVKDSVICLQIECEIALEKDGSEICVLCPLIIL